MAILLSFRTAAPAAAVPAATALPPEATTPFVGPPLEYMLYMVLESFTFIEKLVPFRSAPPAATAAPVAPEATTPFVGPPAE